MLDAVATQASMQQHRLRDRRAACRPSNGDTQPCPKCVIGVLEFNERYRIPLSNGEVVALPAWMCDGPDCHYRRPVRGEHEGFVVRTAARNLRARSSRPLMKARAMLQRARGVLSRNFARNKTR